MREIDISNAFDLSSVGEDGVEATIVASDSYQSELPGRLGVLAITSLSGAIAVRPWRKGGYRVSGTIVAEITQSCIVTLEPITERHEEPFDRTFLPAKEVERYQSDDEVEIDPQADDPPETLEGTSLNLGDLIAEHLALGLNPYPRKPDAAADLPSEEGENERVSPFAALKNLKEANENKEKSES